jgi:putative aldouronate transport system permease protein
VVTGREAAVLRNNKIIESKGRICFNIINYFGLTLVVLITLYPVLYVFAASFSGNDYVTQGLVTIFPKGFTIEAYRRVLTYPMVGVGYFNTIFYTVLQTIISLSLTVLGAYPLSRPRFRGRKLLTGLVVFAMLFSGGIIPTFLVVKGVGLYNSIGSMVLPSAVSTFNLIIMRTFFEQIPLELEEAGALDGCNPLQILMRIFLPLAIPGLVTVGLFYAVNQWNSFFPALIYLRDSKLMPLQIVIRDIVIQNDTTDMTRDLITSQDQVGETIKYAVIVVSILPMMILYPFIQRFFVKGAMLGAVKG